MWGYIVRGGGDKIRGRGGQTDKGFIKMLSNFSQDREDKDNWRSEGKKEKKRDGKGDR